MHQEDIDTCIQGNPGASASGPSPVNFLKDYVPPRKPTTKQVKLPKEPKYELVEPEIPPGVIIEGDMLGTVGNMKFADHDLEDIKKFPELAPDKYMHTKLSPRFTGSYSRATRVGTGLEKTCILNLLEIPHFGRSTEINICIKLLLSCIHGGFLWLDRPVS
jgi:hypothetical protein